MTSWQCPVNRSRKAVSRKPTALPDPLVYDVYGLTKDEIRIVKGG